MPQIKRSISIKGHRTSYSLEAEYHRELETICKTRGLPLARMVAEIDKTREPETNLSSALRLFVLGEIIRERDQLRLTKQD